jgi:cellulose synthase/poly-beta-1,6-N-acetylglucosamine synthase-like glycosyltransferase
MAEYISSGVLLFNYFVLFYFLSLNGMYILLTLLSFVALRKHMKEKLFSAQYKRLFHSSFYKPISVIVPAYNEELTVCDNVKSLLQLRYPEFEIVVVNDGSSDNTLGVLIETYCLKRSFRPVINQLPSGEVRGVYRSPDFPHLIVVDKENGGKADALNAGINVAQFPLVSAIDSDSILEADVLTKLVRPFLNDPKTVAVGGIVRVVNGCTVKAGEVIDIDLSPKALPNYQIVEYLRSFLFGRVGWDMLDGLIIISGAFGVFLKSAVIQCGGYLQETVGEDMELIVRMHRVMRENKKPYRITFVPEPVCWTEVPEDLKTLGRQRNRWQRGLMESLVAHRVMLFNPRYGIIGLLAMPFFFVFEMLGPIIEFTGYIVFFSSLMLGIVNYKFAILFLSAAIMLGMVLSVGSLVLEELTFRKYPKYSHIFILFWYSILENFWYRQINTWWRFMGIVDYFRGKKSWGKMERKGVKQQT